MTTVLVIDDSAMVRKYVGLTLAREGYVTVGAVDGIDGLVKLAEFPDIQLIVCDVHMPRMNGLEFLEHLGARTATIPVILLTADCEPEFVQRAKALGANAWFVKPFKPALLTAAVRKLAPPLA